MDSVSPLSIVHKVYESTADSRPATENIHYHTRIPGFSHTFHGRGDSLSVNSSSAQNAITKSPEFQRIVLQIVMLRFKSSFLLQKEVDLLRMLGNATWQLVMEHFDNAPQWIMGGMLGRHMLMRPWIAYRIDVAANLLRSKTRKPGEPRHRADARHEEEIRFEQAAKALLANTTAPSHASQITCSTQSRSALVFGSLVKLRTVVAISFAVDSFDTPSCLAEWLEEKWKTNWKAPGVVNTDAVPFVWIYAFGMEGKSQVERQDWAKYSPFIYSLFPVLAHVPAYRARERTFRVEPDENAKLFISCDQHMETLKHHLGNCPSCQHAIENVHRHTQETWDLNDLNGTFNEDIGIGEMVCLLDHMRIWPVIERTLAMHNRRLMFSPRGWKLVYRTYCLGAIALHAATDTDGSWNCSFFKDSALNMLEEIGLMVFKGIVHQLGIESKLGIPIISSPAENRGVPVGRKISELSYDTDLKKGFLRSFLGPAQPVLAGQIPTVQWRGERYDRRFLMLLVNFEPNMYDHAIIRMEQDARQQVLLIQRMVEGDAKNFFPQDFISNWMDSRQTTNYDWKLTHRIWHVSRLAPGMRLVEGQSSVTSQVSPVLVGSLGEMYGTHPEERLIQGRSKVSCPIVPLMVETSTGYRDTAFGDSFKSACHALPIVDGRVFGAFLFSSHSQECYSPRRKEYLLEIVVAHGKVERTGLGVAMAPLFTVMIVGEAGRHSDSTVVKWRLPVDDGVTGSSTLRYNSANLEHGYRKLPLALKGGKALSLVFRTETSTRFKSSPRDHIPVPIVAPDAWSPQWCETDIRIRGTFDHISVHLT